MLSLTQSCADDNSCSRSLIFARLTVISDGKQDISLESSHDLVFLATTQESSGSGLKTALKVGAVNPCNVVQLLLFDQSQTTSFCLRTVI